MGYSITRLVISGEPMPNKLIFLLNEPERKRLPDQVAEQIKRLILTRKLRINDKMPSDRSLAEPLKVSPVVVRTAMQSLEQAGYVEIRHGRNGGSFVTYNIFKPFLGTIYDLFFEGNLTLNHFFETRCKIERFSAVLAVDKVTAQSIDRLKAINVRLVQNGENREILADNNLEFHSAVAEIRLEPAEQAHGRRPAEHAQHPFPR